ncbi:hypothetical protein K438DRAFT_1630308 [Mycena galopus ATCC 62051]|nr:hypothetical protein K438DRAFT_1630308 [Mycena galopus ATCC 62051]
MLSLCSAPATGNTSLIDKAKQSANDRKTCSNRSRSGGLRSMPISNSDMIASTRAGRKGSVYA